MRAITVGAINGHGSKANLGGGEPGRHQRVWLDRAGVHLSNNQGQPLPPSPTTTVRTLIQEGRGGSMVLRRDRQHRHGHAEQERGAVRVRLGNVIILPHYGASIR